MIGSAGGRGASGWRQVTGFVVLAYALSWIWWVPLVLGDEVVGAGASPTHLPGLVGPMLAALATVYAAERRPGLAGLVASMANWRIGGRWWAIVLSPLLLAGAVTGVRGTVTGDWPAASELGRVNGFPDLGGVAGVVVLLVVVNGLGEETGWRGFLQARLQERMAPIAAVAVVAVLWAGWHLPLFWLVESFRDFSPATLAGFLVGMASGAVVLAWVFGRTGSVLAVACWHAAYTMAVATSATDDATAAVVTTGVILQAAVLLVLEMSRGGGVLLPGRPAGGPH